jgi:AraC-like DNA-binding protein
MNFGFYDDSGNGGNSKIEEHHISDGAICMEYVLNEGFLSPYIGMSISDKNGLPIDLNRFNLMKISIETQIKKSILFSVYTPNPYHKDKTNPNDLIFETIFEISPGKHHYSISMDNLRIPDWCRIVNNIPVDAKLGPNLRHVRNFNIATAYRPELETKSSLKIYSVSFGRDNSELALLLVLSEMLIVLVLITIYYLKSNATIEKSTLTIKYKPVETESENFLTEKFLYFINNHFSDSNLSINRVSEITGISPRKIATFIQQQFGCNFKTYVNQLRIAESKRLLKETRLNMGEIAFKVGFNNQSHFNRVFKTYTEISPSEYRAN